MVWDAVAPHLVRLFKSHGRPIPLFFFISAYVPIATHLLTRIRSILILSTSFFPHSHRRGFKQTISEELETKRCDCRSPRSTWKSHLANESVSENFS